MLERYSPDRYGRMVPDPQGDWLLFPSVQLAMMDALEANGRAHEATIADLRGQVAEWHKRVQEADEAYYAVGELNDALQQRVAQLEGERDELRRDRFGIGTAWVGKDKYEALQADHARVLGLVRTACERWRAQTNAQEGISFRMAMKELEASLPAQPAQGGALYCHICGDKMNGYFDSGHLACRSQARYEDAEGETRV